MSDNFNKLNNKTLSARAKVILVIEEILNGKSLSSHLEPLLVSVGDNNRGFVHEMLLGTLRQWWALARITDSLIERPVSDKGVLAALHIGLYQLLYMNTAEYAAINDTVNALKELNKDYGTGLVNAILRKVQKSADKYRKKVQKNHSLPNWLAKELKQDWPMVYDELGTSLRQPAPIFLRTNAKFTTLDNYLVLLNNCNVDFKVVPLGVSDEHGILLKDVIKIKNLPNFLQGHVSVQDRHAQILGHLLKSVNPPKNFRMLDACTAPGGKLTQVLELAASGVFHVEHITALDSDSERLKRVHDNLSRSQVAGMADVICADGTTYQADAPFDVIVLDAPCTATGVIRRHPDIALLRTKDDVQQTVELQAEILQNLWQNLAVGGHLLYVTCSLLKAENATQIENFLAKTPNAAAVDFTLTLPNQIKQSVGYQCLPLSKDDGDGFYYAVLQKR
ncbi:16S rRNA (cytosine(967)-C(5))-methyltransferase RsmB [Moraxella marmotae]|uniref:16S rRNA (cytosine(967)-C(5))-methyltransferase RsmB n=1 Tax=Moraxella marmotae TaxID=3344520 RepID=UPI0035F2C03F